MSDEKDTKGAVLGAYDCVPTVTCVAGVGIGMKHVNDLRAENKTNTLGSKYVNELFYSRSGLKTKKI